MFTIQHSDGSPDTTGFAEKDDALAHARDVYADKLGYHVDYEFCDGDIVIRDPEAASCFDWLARISTVCTD